MQIAVTMTLAFVLIIWMVGRFLDPTVRTPLDALDALIVRFIRWL